MPVPIADPVWRFPDVDIPEQLRDCLSSAFATLNATILSKTGAVNSRVSDGFVTMSSALDVSFICSLSCGIQLFAILIYYSNYN